MDDIFLKVSERFYSIQGESTRAGLPCLFIRLAECNLRCAYCDSKYTWEEPGTRTSIADILLWVDGYPGTMVELTGGEPLLQEEIYPLMERLLARERTVLIETNGSIPIEKIPELVTIILDIKCPGSKMDRSVNWENIAKLRERAANGSHDEIKFVLSSEQDFYWAKDIVEKYSLQEFSTVLFSPMELSFTSKRLAELILHCRLPVRLQLQLHRIIWPEIDKGV